MIACYFIYKYNITSTEAIKKIREIRPGSIETIGQEHFIADYEKYHKARKI